MSALYNKLLAIGKDKVDVEQQGDDDYNKQLLKLCGLVYIIESTPHPDDPTYSPMFVDFIIHKSLWRDARKKIEQTTLSYDVFDYNNMTRCYHHLPDTDKRRLLFEMVGKWWFFDGTFPPSLPLLEAFEFRCYFFRQKFAYLPEKFRGMVGQMDFNTAYHRLTKEEHMFLDNLIKKINRSIFLCGCLPVKKKDAFSQRFQDPGWQELPVLDLDEGDACKVQEAILRGEFLYMTVYNHYDGLDRDLYNKLYDIFKT